MKTKLFNHWPILTASLSYVTVVLFLFFSILSKNEGHFIYTLDDPYIHMAIAKNLAQHGVWSIYSTDFTSASSSILWVLLLSVPSALFGAHAITPFLLNALFSLFLLAICYVILKKEKFSQVNTFLILCLILFATPLPGLTFLGMEHILHAVLNLLFIYYASTLIDKSNLQKREIFYLALIAALLSSIRYEGCFSVFMVGLLFWFNQKSVKIPFILMLSTCLPILIFGILSLYEGHQFFPNSILLKKRSTPTLYLASLSLILCFLIWWINQMMKSILSGKKRFFVLSVIGTYSLHLIFARIGWFSRYETYLVVLIILAASILLADILSNKHLKKSIVIPLICILITPLIYRSINSIIKTPIASSNIYQQQYQMSQFVKRFYKDANNLGAFNDIGAVAFYNDAPLLDLEGLANIEVMRAKQNGTFNTEFIDFLSKKNRNDIAIVYDSWYTGEKALPANWIKVGEWKISHNIACACDTVSIYATHEAAKETLIANLKAFENELPEEVEIRR